MNKVIKEQVIDFSEFCRSKNCPQYIEWEFDMGACRSCKLVGQSYYVNEYPKDCLYLHDIQAYEQEQHQYITNKEK